MYFVELYISFSLTNKVPITTKRAITRKYLLTLDTPEKITYFDLNYKNRSDVDHDKFISDMSAKGIQFYNDEDIIDLPVRESLYYGDFSVIKIFTDQSEEIINGLSQTVYKKRYLLDKLTYSSKASSLKETELLKLGASLIVNKNSRNTRYTIISLDNSTNTVTLELAEGYDAIELGTDILSIYSSQNNEVNIDIPIGFDQSIVVFVRPINEYSNVPSLFWSPGVALYTNELTIQVSNQNSVDLETFYKNEVSDFGMYLLGLAKEGTPPSILGVKPDAPILDSTNFQVVEINQHLTKQQKNEDLKKISNLLD